MPSQEHDKLRDRIIELADRFVDFDIPLEREPNSHELDMIASFKMLAHAEFETFIETRVRDTIRASIVAWKTDRRPTKALLGLLLRWYPYFEKDKNPYSALQSAQQVTELLERLSRKAEGEIEENNGIKKDATSRLCYSVSIFSDDLSPTLLASLESYGKNRGDVAHNAVGKVRTLDAPRVEATNATQIVALLVQLDQLLTDNAA